MTFRYPISPALILSASLGLLNLPLAPALVTAGQNANARMLVHLAAPVGKNGCDLAQNPPICTAVETSGQVGPGYFAYVVLMNISQTAGLGGAQFGILYNGAAGQGVDVFGWTVCADFEFQSTGWPASGGGNLVTWSAVNCHPPTISGETVGVAGYFYVSAYTPDEIEMTRRPVDNRAVVADCNFVEDEIGLFSNPFGWAAFTIQGTVPGSKPCGAYSQGCRIRGPAEVTAGQTGIIYTMDPRDAEPGGQWQISGNAQISSSDFSTATVDATGPGAFTISYRPAAICAPEGCGCSFPVVVHAGTPTEPATWSRIKAGYSIAK